jgi:hypothetical protein
VKAAGSDAVRKLKKPPLPFHFLKVDLSGFRDEQLFLKEKLRQQICSIRELGNGTGMVACGWCCDYKILSLFPE